MLWLNLTQLGNSVHYQLKTEEEDTESNNQTNDPIVVENDKNEEAERLPILKAELAALNVRMDAEYAKYKAGLDTINKLTNFKRTPVQEGTQAYYKCIEASKAIKEVEAGATNLKSEKAQLKTLIKELEALE